MIRIKDIAEELHVSTTTVSNVIHGKDQRVSKELRDRIRKYLDERGYVPNMSAMMLAQTRSPMIGIVLPKKRGTEITLSDPYYSRLVGCLEREIRKKGYYMYLIAEQTEEDILQQALAWNLTGLITCNFAPDAIKSLREKYARNLVAIDTISEDPAIRSVNLDDFGGGYMAGQYLISCNHKNIGMLADNDEAVDHYRWKGFQKACQDAKIKMDETKHFIMPAEESAREVYMESKLAELTSCSALFVSSDFYALYVSSFLQSRGIRIPEDISIIGFDDLIYAELARPKLTTIRQNISQKAVNAVRFLLQENENLSEKRILLKPELIERESVHKI